MNRLDVLTDDELAVVSGGDKSTVPVIKAEPLGKGTGSTISDALEKAADLLGTGHF